MWQKMMMRTTRGIFELFTAGQGDPVCVTHYYSAFTEKGNTFADRFAAGRQVFLVNLKGCGQTDRAADEHDLSMEASVHDLEAIREALGLQRWSFAGHSTGGMLGLLYGILYPERLIKLVVAGAAASYAYMSDPDSIYCRDHPQNARLRQLFAILRSPETSAEAKGAAGREWVEMSLYRPDKWDEYFAKPSSGKVVQSRLDYYNRHLYDYDIRERLPDIRTPSLILCGRHDSQCPVRFSEELHRLIPGSELTVFEESNHSPHTEEPDKFVEVIDRFWSGTGLGKR
ncbi:alpha/beta fold hydrolase [Paenibacillus ginsengarvi]|uniref:Alpha/beta fold hydrolase n=1 Tax=Paenibacillus ginsengarvi TaxID=400777 RepID=A0A3B0C056_9BACL|nr:alpha/beta fold hydrolase [Paenibacillus ginsengarvi]RKN78191.1 alpha/beta fold hydrolase [Paenibacillus ginsengarvi]